MRTSIYHQKFWVVFILYASALVILALLCTIPENASEEYRYTIEVLFKYYSAPCLIAPCVLLLYKALKRIKANWATILTGMGGVGCIIVPMLSPNIYQVHWAIGVFYSLLWITGAFSLCIFCFLMVAKLKGFSSGVFSILGTLFFIWGASEVYFLATTQPDDGKYTYTKTSKHVLANNAAPSLGTIIKKRSGDYPSQPTHPSHSAAEAVRRYDRLLYDVRYTLDKYGHRVVAVYPEKPKDELLLFGCSFTFGHGLENEQTWAWKLSMDLGPDWLVTNYAMNGFGAQQMLGMLEEHELEPLPQAPRREALFLSIRHHLHRFTSFYNNRCIRYSTTVAYL